MNSTFQIPYRFREAAFRRYEGVIKEIVERFPERVVFDPQPYSVETFSCRLRDAMTSLNQYQWETDINLSSFNLNYPDIIISVQGDKVVAGSRATVKRENETPIAFQTMTTEGEAVRVSSAELLRAICLVHHHRVVKAPSYLHVDHSMLDTLSALEYEYDIVIERCGQHVKIL